MYPYSVIRDELVKKVELFNQQAINLVEAGISVDDIKLNVDPFPKYFGYHFDYFTDYTGWELAEPILLKNVSYSSSVKISSIYKPILVTTYTVRNQYLDPCTLDMAQSRRHLVIENITPSFMRSIARWYIDAIRKDNVQPYTLSIEDHTVQSTCLYNDVPYHSSLSNTAKYVYASTIYADEAYKTIRFLLDKLDSSKSIKTLVDTFVFPYRKRSMFTGALYIALKLMFFSGQGVFIDLLPGQKEPEERVTMNIHLDDTVKIEDY